MKPGRASQTAVLVCTGRAIAHEQSVVPHFVDPTAYELLPEAERAQVRDFRKGPPRRLGARLRHHFLGARAAMMAVRTLFVDEAVRQARHSQVVILGAGLDGRAFRMAELARAVVFEVDHPDSQREKRARVAALHPVARELKFVPVDFAREDLSRRLAEAGHDREQPTTWLWEGVVMYLTRAEVDATLTHLSRLSVAGSRLVIVYLAPGHVMARLVGVVVRRIGEPFRSAFRAPEMRALLAKHGFDVVLDEDLFQAAQRLAPTVGGSVRRIRHLRLVTAVFRTPKPRG